MRKPIRLLAAAAAAALASLSFGSLVAQADVSTATIDTTKPTSLTIHKYEGPASTAAECKPTGQPVPASCLDGKTPLAGAEFTLYKVMDLKTNADWKLAGENYLGKTGAPSPLPASAAVVTTGANGTVTASGLQQGLYYVVETKTPPGTNGITYTGAVPFYITLPMTTPADNAWDYDLDVYPKNLKQDKPHKAVIDAGSIKVGDPIGYKVSTKLPAWTDVVGAPGTDGKYTKADGTVNGWDIGSYTLIDKFSKDLSNVAVGSVKIIPANVDPTTYTGAPLATLVEGTDYYVLKSTLGTGETLTNIAFTGWQASASSPSTAPAARAPNQLLVDYTATVASVPDNGRSPTRPTSVPA